MDEWEKPKERILGCKRPSTFVNGFLVERKFIKVYKIVSAFVRVELK